MKLGLNRDFLLQNLMAILSKTEIDIDPLTRFT